MNLKPLTDKLWRDLVKQEIAPAFAGQLPDGFAAHADWVGRKLLAESWSYAEAHWSVGQVVTHYRRLDNLLAMLTQARDGRVGRDGEVVGGWERSQENRALMEARAGSRSQEECREIAKERGRLPFCGQMSYCRDCGHGAELPGKGRGRYDSSGGFSRVSEAIDQAAKTGGHNHDQ